MDSEVLNLLLLPLLGGYIFCSRCHWTAFATRRADGQRLIYSSSVVGVLLLLAARALEKALHGAAVSPARDALILWMTRASIWATLAAAVALLVLSHVQLFPENQRRTSRWSGLILLAVGVAGACLALSFSIAGVLVGVLVVSALLFITGLLSRWIIAGAAHHPEMEIPVRASLLIPALLLVSTTVLVYGPGVALRWPEFSDIKYSGVALFAASLGAITWMPANVLFPSRWAWRRAHETGLTSGLERLLFRAFKTRSPIQVTLKDGKVYSGFILEIPAPIAHAEGGCIEFLPMSSGYRDPTSKKVTITTDYARVIARLSDPKSKGGPSKDDAPGAASEGKDAAAARARIIRERVSSLVKAIPVSEVQIASMYDNQYSEDDFAIAKPPSR